MINYYYELKEDVKIFKQDPDENSVEHIATLDKVYFNGVFKKILKANDLSSQDVDIELFNLLLIMLWGMFFLFFLVSYNSQDLLQDVLEQSDEPL